MSNKLLVPQKSLVASETPEDALITSLTCPVPLSQRQHDFQSPLLAHQPSCEPFLIPSFPCVQDRSPSAIHPCNDRFLFSRAPDSPRTFAVVFPWKCSPLPADYMGSMTNLFRIIIQVTAVAVIYCFCICSS